MTYKELAKKIAKFYRENPDSWCQSKLSINHLGISIPPLDDTACKWCLLGATIKFDPVPFAGSARAVLQAKISAKVGSVPSWNDASYRTVGDVIDLLEKVACE